MDGRDGTSQGKRFEESMQFWEKFLSDRAIELGLDVKVRSVKPREGAGVLTWVVDGPGGELVELGWSVEQAEITLREMAGQ